MSALIGAREMEGVKKIGDRDEWNKRQMPKKSKWRQERNYQDRNEERKAQKSMRIRDRERLRERI